MRDRLWSAFGFDKAELPLIVAVVGSGGKTSLIGQLAKAGAEHHMRVAVLTTTHIWKPAVYREAFYAMEPGTVTVFGWDCGNGKLTYPGDVCYEKIAGGADLILVEADGSRGLPVKFPGSNEPVIPENVNVILCVFGMSGLGKPGAEVCHRWELIPKNVKSDRTEREEGKQKDTVAEQENAGERTARDFTEEKWESSEIMTEECVSRLLEAGYGKPLSERYPKADFFYCMNQADNPELTEAAERILQKMGRRGSAISLKKNMHRIDFIYLASGFGRRFGSNKLLEPVEGKPLYRHGLEMLKGAADLLRAVDNGPEVRLIVVSQYPEILNAARGQGAIPVYNGNSAEGITASIHLGIEAAKSAGFLVGRDTFAEEAPQMNEGVKVRQAYLFSVADQPWLRAESVAALVREFFESDKGMACLSDGSRRGNPVIFSENYEEELMALTGDTGGSRILRRYPEDVLTVQAEEEELRDIDNPADMGEGF